MSEHDREAIAANTRTVELRERGDVHGLIELLDSPLETSDFSIRFAALVQLGKLGDRRAVPHIIPLLADDDLSVRAGAIVALGRLNAREAVPLVVGALDDEHPAVRQRSAEALATLGVGLPEARRALTAVLDDDLWYVRKSALAALSAIADSTVVPVLEERARRERFWRRRHYKNALRTIRSRERAAER